MAFAVRPLLLLLLLLCVVVDFGFCASTHFKYNCGELYKGVNIWPQTKPIHQIIKSLTKLGARRQTIRNSRNQFSNIIVSNVGSEPDLNVLEEEVCWLDVV